MRLCTVLALLLLHRRLSNCLSCIACSSISTRECQLNVDHFDYSPIYEVCIDSEFAANQTMECAVVTWLEQHHLDAVWYVQKLCTYAIEGFENMTFCDAFGTMALRLGYNQSTCYTCKKDFCNDKRIKYNKVCPTADVSNVRILAFLLPTVYCIKEILSLALW